MNSKETTITITKIGTEKAEEIDKFIVEFNPDSPSCKENVLRVAVIDIYKALGAEANGNYAVEGKVDEIPFLDAAIVIKDYRPVVLDKLNI